jgi:NitT/TauT family transport system substrate-binding protein
VDNLSSLTEEEQQIQRQVLAASIENWQIDPPGYTEPQAWEHMQDLLLQMGMMEKPLELSDAYSNAFIGD